MELHSIIQRAVTEALNSNATANFKKADFDLVGINEASSLTGYSKHTLYKMTSKHEIPFIKRPGGRKIFFSKKALHHWIEFGEN
ncbi:MAG: helix-turn-helix domain-containing protein [Bacteroidales bacterium]|nr:helix-turn-helix domain-containing protein [Bacteroidales bacterium]